MAEQESQSHQSHQEGGGEHDDLLAILDDPVRAGKPAALAPSPLAGFAADRSPTGLQWAIFIALRWQNILYAKEFVLDTVKSRPERVPRRFNKSETALPRGTRPTRFRQA